MKILKNIILLLFLSLISLNSYAELTVEEIIKGRKAIFSENYKTAKRVNILINNIEFEDAKEYIYKMTINYENLLNYFPENSKEGFGTEALPSIWENKNEFNALMKKSAEDMIKLAAVIEDAEDLRAEMKTFMWSNCKACHSKYRAPH